MVINWLFSKEFLYNFELQFCMMIWSCGVIIKRKENRICRFDKLCDVIHHALVTIKPNQQRPMTRSFDVFFDLRPNKRVSKQWWGWWFETPSSPLWRNCIEHKLRYSSAVMDTIAHRAPLSFQAAIEHKPRQVRWRELHVSVVTEWSPARLHK